MSQLLQDFFWPYLSKLFLSEMTTDHMKSASSQSVASMLTKLWHQCSQGIFSVQSEEFESWYVGICSFHWRLSLGMFLGSYGWWWTNSNEFNLGRPAPALDQPCELTIKGWITLLLQLLQLKLQSIQSCVSIRIYYIYIHLYTVDIPFKYRPPNGFINTTSKMYPRFDQHLYPHFVSWLKVFLFPLHSDQQVGGSYLVGDPDSLI